MILIVAVAVAFAFLVFLIVVSGGVYYIVQGYFWFLSLVPDWAVAILLLLLASSFVWIMVKRSRNRVRG